MIEVVLPYPPTVNHYWGRKHHVRRVFEKGKWKDKVICQNFIKREGEIFHKQVENILQYYRKKEPYTGNVRLEVDIYPPDKRKRDTNNLLKALEDSLQKSKVIADDNQICVTLTRRCEIDRPNGKVIIRLLEI
jgi:crossover junction endodeoxyribonuclease RusA